MRIPRNHEKKLFLWLFSSSIDFIIKIIVFFCSFSILIIILRTSYHLLVHNNDHQIIYLFSLLHIFFSIFQISFNSTFLFYFFFFHFSSSIYLYFLLFFSSVFLHFLNFFTTYDYNCNYNNYIYTN